MDWLGEGFGLEWPGDRFRWSLRFLLALDPSLFLSKSSLSAAVWPPTGGGFLSDGVLWDSLRPVPWSFWAFLLTAYAWSVMDFARVSGRVWG